MKSAYKAYTETIKGIDKCLECKDEELKALKEKTIRNSTALCENYIENLIDSAISNLKSEINIEFINKSINTKYNGYVPWFYPLKSRSNWNRNAKSYYTISVYPDGVFNLDLIIKKLKEAGYEVKVKKSTINKATSKTGKYSFSYNTEILSISWAGAKPLTDPISLSIEVKIS